MLMLGLTRAWARASAKEHLRFVIVQLVAIVIALFPGLPMAHFLFACVTRSSSKTGWGKAWEEGKMCNFRGWEFNCARLQSFEPATWTLLSLWKLYHRHTQDWPYHFAHFSLVAKQQTNDFLKWLYSSYLPVTHLPGFTFVGGPALQYWHTSLVSHL